MSTSDDRTPPVSEQLEPVVEEGVKAFVPGGGAIVKIAQALTRRGEYSFDHKSMPIYIQFISEDLDRISKNVQRLLELEDRKKPDAADIAATLEAIGEASRKTTNYKKRELLRHAAVNAFDPEFYEEGLVRRFLKSIEELEYGDVELLRRIVEHSRELNTGTRLKFEQAGLSGGRGSKIDDYHFKNLVDAAMALNFSNQACNPTAYGKRFLKFVSAPEESSESKDSRSESD